jgi:hypothetical protein
MFVVSEGGLAASWEVTRFICSIIFVVAVARLGLCVRVFMHATVGYHATSVYVLSCYCEFLNQGAGFPTKRSR